MCKQVGLSNEEMEDITIGDCLDYIQEYIDDQNNQTNQKSNIRKAGQDDFDGF